MKTATAAAAEETVKAMQETDDEMDDLKDELTGLKTDVNLSKRKRFSHEDPKMLDSFAEEVRWTSPSQPGMSPHPHRVAESGRQAERSC